jgi:DNA-binding NtrC family response regulator
MDVAAQGKSGMRRVLVVDDDPRFLADVSERLMRLSYDVITRSTAAGATAVLLSEECDFVLLDVLMPGMRAESLVRLIERPTRRRRTSLILLSKLTPGEMRPLLASSHAIGAIEKGLGAAAFILAFERCVRSAEREQQALEAETETAERISAVPSRPMPPPSSHVRAKLPEAGLAERIERLFQGKLGR